MMWTAIVMVAIILVGNVLAMLIASRRVRLENEERRRNWRSEFARATARRDRPPGPPNELGLG